MILPGLPALPGVCLRCGPVTVTELAFSDFGNGMLLCMCSCGHIGHGMVAPRHERQLLDAGVKTLSEEAAEFLSGSSV